MIKVPFFLLTYLAFSFAASDSLEEKNAKNFTTAIKYVRATYPEIIKDLRDHTSINRDALISAFKHDPFLRRVKTGDGHAKFVCDLLGISFCVVGHGTNDITGDKEFAGFHAAIQQYANVLKIFYQSNENKLAKALKSMKPEDWKKLVTEEQDRYANYSKEKPNCVKTKNKKTG